MSSDRNRFVPRGRIGAEDYFRTHYSPDRAPADVRAVYREACRIRARYAHWFGQYPHTRSASPWFNGTNALAIGLADAMREARIMIAARDLDLRFDTMPSEFPWDGEGEAPRHLLDADVRDERGTLRASLGAIAVDSLDDPYLATCEADLYAEAIEAIAAERDAEATREAESLAARASYAGPSEVCAADADAEARAARIVCGMLRAGRVVIGPEGEILSVSEVRS